MHTSPRAKSHQRCLLHYGTEDLDMSVKTQSRGWPGQTLQKEWWWTVTEWETALLAERGSKHEAPYRIPPMSSPLKCFAGYLATYADWSWVVCGMGLHVCFPFQQAEQSPILSPSTTIPSVRF